LVPIIIAIEEIHRPAIIEGWRAYETTGWYRLRGRVTALLGVAVAPLGATKRPVTKGIPVVVSFGEGWLAVLWAATVLVR
jgi:hypothetical protein